MARPREAEFSSLPQSSAKARQPARDGSEVTAWTGLPGGARVDPLVGTTLHDAYVVVRLVGEGGMGRVFEARHTRIPQKRYAIKVLRPEFALHTEAVARFQREAETAASVTHPNVVGVYDVDCTPDGLPYLVCEYLDGLELGEYLDAVGRLEPFTAVHICYEICKALEAAHASGVIHRDLKPQNVFLVGKFEDRIPQRPNIKVLDFGLSRFQNSAGNSLTRTGMIMGTPSFMAPEQARGKKTDHRTDIYGVGAILYNLLTGRPPFAEDTPHLTVLAVMERDPPRPRSIDPAISQHLELIVQRAMARDPADRYPDATALKNALDLFAGPTSSVLLSAAPAPSGSRTSVEREAEEAESARPRLLVVMVLAAAFITALLAMALVSIGVLTGWLSFRPVELALLLVATLGTALTPGIILIRRIRRVVWNNTARVLDTLERVTAILLAGMLAYGAANLVVRFGDAVLARFSEARWFGHPSGIAWPGWDLVFPVIGAVAAGAVVLRGLAVGEGGGYWRRRLAGPALYAAALLIAGGALYAGLTWRAANGSLPRIEEAPAPSGIASALQATPSRAETVAPIAPVASMARGSRVSPADLASAASAGVEALVPLANKYPDDPEVLRALVFAQAARATGHVEAMEAAKHLFKVAPERTEDAELRLLVSNVAKTSKDASQHALTLMAEGMGTAGPDLLYDLAIARTSAANKAEKLLADPNVQERFSPALRVAYELRSTKTCAGRLPLLGRASAEGDARSIYILEPLSKMSKRGCGKWRNKPCPAPCAAEAERYRDAVAKISERIRSTP